MNPKINYRKPARSKGIKNDASAMQASKKDLRPRVTLTFNLLTPKLTISWQRQCSFVFF